MLKLRKKKFFWNTKILKILDREQTSNSGKKKYSIETGPVILEAILMQKAILIQESFLSRLFVCKCEKRTV